MTINRSTLEFQIDDNTPFVPDSIIYVGTLLGMEEKTKDGDRYKSFQPSSCYSVIHYVCNGKEVENFYRRGVWEDGEEYLRFHVSGLLSIKEE